MDENRPQPHRYFLLSFATAFFVLSILFLFLMITVHPKPPATLGAQLPDVDAVAYVPTGEDALTVLFIGAESGSADAESFILARFDPARGQVPVVVFPPQTLVWNNGKQETMAQVYRYGGADYLRTALAGTLDLPIHRYVRISQRNFVTATTAIGTVEFDLTQDIPLENGGMNLVLSRGRQLLDGQKVLTILNYRGYDGGELARCRIAGELTAAIVNQRIDVAESTLVDKVFETIINLIDTDISYPDYDTRKEAAVFLARLGRDPAFSLPVSGRFDDEEAEYTLSDTFLAQLAQTFG